MCFHFLVTHNPFRELYTNVLVGYVNHVHVFYFFMKSCKILLTDSGTVQSDSFLTVRLSLFLHPAVLQNIYIYILLLNLRPSGLLTWAPFLGGHLQY